MKNSETDAILLFAHGSRVADLKDELAAQIELVKEMSGYRIVEMSFLEITEPDMMGGVRKCVEQGARKIRIVPYLLNMGNHVRRDLPEKVKEVQAAFPGIEISVSRHLGVDPLLAELVIKRAERG
jgi:sirohydrochlorin ferrochelatase